MSFKVIDVGTPGKLVTSACSDTRQPSLCLSATILVLDISRLYRNRTFSTGYANLMRSYGGLLEPRESSLTPLTSTFNAEHFIRRLS